MTLILRKCWSDGSSRNGFKYGNVGERVNCPDWNPEPTCGNGLHGLLNANGDWNLLEGSIWLVIDADDQIVNIDSSKCKFNTGVIKFRGYTKELEMSNIVKEFHLNENNAIRWAQTIGNHDFLFDKFHSSNFAYCWAYYIGTELDFLKHRITSSRDAFNWAYQFGNHDIMISKITDSSDAYQWAFHIGNRDIMINKITDSYSAILWAINFGDHDIMKKIVINDPNKGNSWIPTWNQYFPNNKISFTGN